MMYEVKKELENRGYVADVVEVVKNGVKLVGIAVGEGDAKVRPTIYKQLGWDSMTVEEIADEVERVYAEAGTLQVDVAKVSDPNFLREHARLCIQRRGKEDILKNDYLDLEIYARCYVSGSMTFKITSAMAKGCDGLLEAAIKNTAGSFSIRGMSEVVSEMLGIDVGELLGDRGEAQYVVNNASCLYYPEVFKAFCCEHGIEGCYILPSSIHEVIIMPADERFSKAELDEMVSSINRDQVEAVDQLADHAYYYSLDDNKIIY